MPEEDYENVSISTYETIKDAKFEAGVLFRKTIADCDYYINKIESLYQEYKTDDKYKNKIEDVYNNILYPEERHQKAIVRLLERAYEKVSSDDWINNNEDLEVKEALTEGDQTAGMYIKIQSVTE